jgi:hypothetical protein
MTTRTALISAIAALLALAAQGLTIRFSPSELAVRIVLPATIVVVAVALWRHRRYAGVWVMYVGLAANLAGILANGGLMPIEHATVVSAVGEERAQAYQTGEWLRGSKNVLVADGGGRALALGDSIAVRAGAGGFAASPGDIVVWAGLLILAAESAYYWQRSAARGGSSTRGKAAPASRTGAEISRAAGSSPTPQ